ncbi:uncharacterized protein O3C94_021493 [Discoglossus pictus]
MWKWMSADETNPAGGASPNQEGAGTMSVADLTEQLAQTEQLVVQLKELIREKDNDLRKKDQQLKEEKESLESKVSKAKLQNKAKIASLSSQLEELKKQLGSSKAPESKSEHRKGSGDADQENASANRGKLLVLRKRVEELESQLSQKNEAIQRKDAELESQRLRGSEMDAMIVEKDKKLAEKEAYIIDLQVSAGSTLSNKAVQPVDDTKNQMNQKDSSPEDLQLLILNLTRKVGESEERCSLLQEQAESLKSLLQKERNHFQEREAMYMENIRVFQGMTQDKEKEMQEQAQKHEQELFKLAAKSDASADLHQLLKALKQKLHEEEEVLSGKNQVIDVLQKELDNKEQQCKEMNEKCKRLQSERENLQSKLDAEKHVMRAQLRDLMEKHNTALQDIKEKHELEIQEKCQTVLHLQKRLQDLGSSGITMAGSVEGTEAIVQLQDEVKLKTEEASKSEAKFLKMKAWSKSKIRQLEEELKTFESKNHDISVLTNRVCELENDKKELEEKLNSLSELQSINEELISKLVIYEEQQRKMQADLEQVAKRADSQTSESGSVDELQNQLLEWNEMTPEADGSHAPDREEKCVLAMRMLEEDREAMDSGQQELEEELNAARGLGKARQSRRKGSKGSAKLQDEFDFNRKSFEDQNLTLDSIDSAEGENMGGLRIVVEELEVERNQLQEQIMNLEERCQELEDRLQLQARIETLQTENERLQAQLAQLRQLNSRETEKHHDLITTMNQQLNGLIDRKAFLENAVVEKEQLILDITGKVEQMGTIQKNLQEKEATNKDLLERLDQNEQKLEEATKKQIKTDSENSALKLSNNELEEKVSVLKEKVLKQDSALQKLQQDLDQTNEELDRLNTSHLEERSQLIHDLQRCEREMDILKEELQEKDKELTSLCASLTEYTEQVNILKDQIYFKEEQMREMTDALVKAERENHLLKEAQTSDVQETSAQISSLSEQLHEMDVEFNKAKYLNESKTKEAEELIGQINENGITIKNLRSEIQAQSVTHNNHVMECSTQITSLKEQINASVAKCEEMEMNYRKEIDFLRSQLEKDSTERENLAGLLEEKNNKEQRVENELKLAKEQYNQVISGISKKDEDLEKLSKQLVEQKELHKQLNMEVQSKQDELSSLQKKLDMVVQDREEKLKYLQENVQELQKHIGEKSGMICKLNLEKEELQTQNKQLEMALAEKEHNLAAHVNNIEELKQSIHDLEGKYQHLISEKDCMLEELSGKESKIASLNQTLQDAQGKMTVLEQILAEEQKKFSILEHDKDELVKKLEYISAQSSDKDKVVNKQLEESVKECLGLKTSLTEEREMSQSLQNQINSLENQLRESQKRAQEKDDALEAKNAEYNAESRENKEKYLMLQKQIEELSEENEKRKQALQEKDMIINTQSAQAEELRMSLVKLQHEEQSLKEVNIGLVKQVEEINTSIINQKENRERLQQELGHKTEELTIINSTLEILTKEGEKLKQEKEDTLLLVSKVQEQRDSFQSQLLQIQSEASLLKQQVDTFKGQNEALSSDVEQLNTALASKSEEINILSSHLSQQGHTIMSLNDQIDTMLVEKQTLICSIEEKETLLRQKEELIQQTEKKLEGEGYFLQTISALQNELQSTTSDKGRLQQIVDDKEAELKRASQDLKVYRDRSEEAELLKAQLAEHVEVISGLHSQIKNLSENIEQLNVDVTTKEECLRQKIDDYVNLKAQLSDVQSSFDLQKNQIDTLIVEIEQYKIAVNDKDVGLQKSALDYEELKQNKNDQCEALSYQVTNLEQTNINLNSELNEIKNLVKLNEASFSEKEALMILQLEEKSRLVTDIQKAMQELTNTLQNLEHSTTEKDIAIKNVQDKYVSLYDQKSELEQSLVRKEEAMIQETQKKLEEEVRYRQIISALQNELQSTASEKNQLQQIVGEKEVEVKRLSDSNATAELSKLRMKLEELENLVQEARSLKEAAERETSSYQCELTELRSEKNLLVTKAQALRQQFNVSLQEKDRQIAELRQTQQETVALTSNVYGSQKLERVALVGTPGVSENSKSRLDDQSQLKNEIQRYLHEIHQRDLIIQQINAKAVESVEMNSALSSQLKTVSQGLKDTQMRYSDLHTQYYKLQRECQNTQGTFQDTSGNASRVEVPPGAPQERANVLVEIDNSELIGLRRRLAETENHYDSLQQELSRLSERLKEESTRREAAEELLRIADQQSKRLEMKTSSRDYEFSVQMETDDEREALIIDPTQHVVVRKMRGGALTMRRWLRGRSLYCSKLLTSRGKSRYLFLTYLLLLHGLVLMCLTGVL